MRTFSLKKNECISKWFEIDCTDLSLGRIATISSHILQNKNELNYCPHMRIYGNHVILLNIDKIQYTGNKRQQKLYRRHTGYFGGLKEVTLEKMLIKKPEHPIRHAIEGMISKGPSTKFIMRRLHIYQDDKHVHQAQTPIKFDIQTYMGGK